MKHILLSLVIAATSLGAAAQGPAASVRLDVKGCGQHISMLGAGADGWERVTATDNIIAHEWQLTEPRLVQVSFDNKSLEKSPDGHGYIPTKSAMFFFIAQPGRQYKQTAAITADYIDFYPMGDEENDILARYVSAYNPLQNEAVNLMLDTIQPKAAREARSEVLGAKIDSLRRAFLSKHASSVAGLWLMEDMLVRTQIEVPECEKFFLTVSDKYKNHSYYKAVKARIDGYKATAAGQPAPDINTLRTCDGKPFRLDQLRGKYVIVDFWGTWCGACIAGMPAMKAFAEKHADCLSLVSICCGTNMQVPKIKDWLAKHHPEWNWHQLVNGTGAEDYVLKYNVQGYPTKILVSPEGRILKRFVGEDPNMYAEFETLMGK